MRKFGLIGFPLTHSFSKKYFTEIFKREGIDAIYENFPITDIHDFPQLIKNEEPEGINVTIPYKESVIGFLDELTDAVQQIGACNCIAIQDGYLKGYNTDIIGFKVSLRKNLTKEHNKAMVLGTGGASKAVCYVLRQLGIPYIIVSRSAKPGQYTYDSLTDVIVKEHKLIVNTTPLGMYPKMDDCPDIPYDAIGSGHYLYDLVYNPEKTKFLQHGEQRGAVIANGYDMLLIQANESRKIWGI